MTEYGTVGSLVERMTTALRILSVSNSSDDVKRMYLYRDRSGRTILEIGTGLATSENELWSYSFVLGARESDT